MGGGGASSAKKPPAVARAVTPLITRPHFQKDLRVSGAEGLQSAGAEPPELRGGGQRVPPSAAGRQTPGATRAGGATPGGRRPAPPGTSSLQHSRAVPPGTGSSVNILDPEKREWAQKEPMVLNLEDAVESTLEVLEYELERPPSSGGSSVSSLCDDELRRLHAEREALAREGEFEPREGEGAPAVEDLLALQQAIEEM